MIRTWPVLLAACMVASGPAAWVAVKFFQLASPDSTTRHLVSLLLVSPVLEEWIFRGVLLGELRQSGARDCAALALTSVLFALLHAPAAGWLAPLWLIPGLALGLLRLRGAPLLACMALHGWMNACVLAVQ